MSKGKCESEYKPEGYNTDDILIKNIHEAIDFIEQTPEMTRQRDSYTRCLYL